jgi:hypothetical protein
MRWPPSNKEIAMPASRFNRLAQSLSAAIGVNYPTLLLRQ